MNAVPYSVTAGGSGCCGYVWPGGPAFGTYVKMPGYTANGTVLWDLCVGAVGYTRTSVGSTGLLKAENLFYDINATSWNLTVTSVSFTVPLNQWVWVWYRQYASGCNCASTNGIGYFQLGWDTTGVNSNNSTNTGILWNGWASYWGQLGVGVPVTPTTSYDPFPNTADYEMSKFRYTPTGNPAYSAPTIDPTLGNYGIQYNARQPATDTTLKDTGSQWNLAPGSQGITIVADGPYP